MAINPNALFPGQTTAPSSAYPLGGAQDITTPGDGSGTPWNEIVINDTWGMMQAWLTEAGVTASGVPDTAEASQYLEALSRLFTRSVPTTAEILTKELTDPSAFRTQGYHAANDRGGAAWMPTGLTVGGKAGTTEFDLGFIYDASGRQMQIMPGPRNPRQFGAKGDGSNDDTAAVNSAFAEQLGAGGGRVVLDRGTFKCTSEVTMGDRVELVGEGVGVSVLTFSGAVGSFATGGCLNLVGSDSALVALNVDAAKDDIEVEFVSDPGLDPNDLFMIIDDRANSYSDADPDFQAGELCLVARVINTTTKAIDAPMFATTNPNVAAGSSGYPAVNATLRKIEASRTMIRDMTIIGRAPSNSTPVIRVEFCRESRFERLDIEGSREGLIVAQTCHNITISDVVMHNEDSAGAENYGISLISCQRVFLSRVTGGSTNGMLKTEAAATQAIVNREIFVSDCIASQTQDTQGALRFAGNTEHVHVSNSTMAGVQLGGDHYTFTGCDIQGQKAINASAIGRGWAVYFKDMTGMNVNVHSCRIYARDEVTGAGALVYWDDNTEYIYRPSQGYFSDTSVDMAGYPGKHWTMDVIVATAANKPSLQLSRCKFTGSNVTGKGVSFTNTTNNGWDTLEVDGCTFYQTELILGGAVNYRLADTRSIDSPGIGIAFPMPQGSTDSQIDIRGGFVTEAYDAGVNIDLPKVQVRCAALVAINCNQNPSKSDRQSSFVFDPVTGPFINKLTLAGCVFGDAQSPATQTFAYMYDNANFVEDANTTILGGLPVSRSSSGERILDTFDADNELATSNVDVSMQELNNARMNMDQGSALDIGADLSFNAGWGTSPNFNSSTGHDSAVAIFITSGSGSPSANPSFVYTFPDGSFSGAPIAFLQSLGGSTPNTWHVLTLTSTAITVRFIGTPAVSTVYGVQILLVGK